MRYVRENLAVCGFIGIGTRERFAEHGFHGQVQCAEPFDAWISEVCEVLAIPFLDGLPIPEELFQRAKTWFLPKWHRGERVLISCAGGQSRSVSMTAALLAVAECLPFRAALEDVMRAIPDAYPHPVTLASAARLTGTTLTYEDLQEIYPRVAIQPLYPWSDELLHAAAGVQLRGETAS